LDRKGRLNEAYFGPKLVHGLGIQGFLIWLGFIEELESILCKDFKFHVDLMWQHLRSSLSWIYFSYFTGIPSTSRRQRRGNIRKEILSIKTKFSILILTLKVWPKHHSVELGDFSYIEEFY